MARAKTLRKQKRSSENIKAKFKLKFDAEPYSPTEEIVNSDLIGRAIIECLTNNDPEGVMEAISIYLNTLNKAKTAKQAHLSRSTLYHSLRYKNPTIKTLAKIMSAENPTLAKK